MAIPIIEAKDIVKYFPVTKGIFLRRPVGWIRAVDKVSFSIHAGHTFGLVGESGCGKTTIAKLILLLEVLKTGNILFNGQNVQNLIKKRLKEYRKSVQAVFQDPFSSLNPRMKVRDIIAEPFVVNQGQSPKSGSMIKNVVGEVLNQVGLNPGDASLYPHEFSGGQRQRIAVARALVLKPKVVILDEPVSSLDVSIRAQLMNLLMDLQHEYGLTYLLIAHDLALISYMSSHIGVMYLGQLVETGTSIEIYSHPLHPYTEALFSAVLPFHPDDQQKEVIVGEVGSLPDLPQGCHFCPRCRYAKPICAEEQPTPLEMSPGHLVACHLYA